MKPGVRCVDGSRMRRFGERLSLAQLRSGLRLTLFRTLVLGPDMKRILILTLLVALTGCASIRPVASSRSAETELAALRKQLEDVHGNRDASAFAALHTDASV